MKGGGGAVQLEIIYPNLFRINDARTDRRDFKRNLPVPPGSLKLYPRPFERNTRRKQLERVRITPFQFVSFSDVFAESRVSVMSALVLVFVCRVFGLWFKFMRNSVTRFRVGEAIYIYIYIYITDFGFGIGEGNFSLLTILSL